MVHGGGGRAAVSSVFSRPWCPSLYVARRVVELCWVHRPVKEKCYPIKSTKRTAVARGVKLFGTKHGVEIQGDTWISGLSSVLFKTAPRNSSLSGWELFEIFYRVDASLEKKTQREGLRRCLTVETQGHIVYRRLAARPVGVGCRTFYAFVAVFFFLFLRHFFWD